MAAAYECVRVTDMLGTDLELFDFDYDLTFAALLMNADGTIYHTFGGRTAEDPERYLSLDTFVQLLRDTLEEHAAYQAAPDPPPAAPRRTPESIPWDGKVRDCFHCHMVNSATFHHAQKKGTWQESDAWVWPDPVEAGLVLDPVRQDRIAEVLAESPAARAGLRPGDRLVRAGAQHILTLGDLQRVLHHLPGSATTVPLEVERDGQSLASALELPDDWKRPEPATYAWRPTKWLLPMRPGFHGHVLTEEERIQAGLPPGTHGHKVDYFITWGDHAYTGENAQKAGLRKGDILLAVNGRREFASEDELHAWIRLTFDPGDTLSLEVWRDGATLPVALTLLE